MWLFSFSKHCTHQAQPELRLCQEKTSSTAGAGGDRSHHLSSSGRCGQDASERTTTGCHFSCRNRIYQQKGGRMKGPLRSHQTLNEVMMAAEGEEKEMRVTRLGGNICHTNTETDRGIGRPWSR